MQGTGIGVPDSEEGAGSAAPGRAVAAEEEEEAALYRVRARAGTRLSIGRSSRVGRAVQS